MKDGILLQGSNVLLEFKADVTLILFRLLQLSVSKKKKKIGWDSHGSCFFGGFPSTPTRVPVIILNA